MRVLPRSCGPALGRSGFWLSAFGFASGLLRVCVAFLGFSMGVKSPSSWVPASAGSVLLRGRSASSLFPVAGVGLSGCVVVRACWFAGSPRSPLAWASSTGAAGLWLVVVAEDGGARSDLFCLSAALSPADLGSLVAACSAAVASGAVVYPVVAAGGRGVAAAGFFCGFGSVAPGVPAPADGVSLL